MSILLSEQEDNRRDRRREDNTPWWIGAIYKLGIPAAIALFLIWFVVATVIPNIQFIKENLVLHANSSSQVGQDLRDQNIRLSQQNERLMRVLQQICINSAKNNQERNGCFQ